MDKKVVQDAHSIFNEVFDCNVSWETFRHKHLDNPEVNQETCVLVNYDGNVPQGTNSFMDCTLFNGPQQLNATFSCDTAVRPAFRGKHIFYHIVTRAINLCQEDACDLIYALPNTNSYHGFQKLGFQELGKMDGYAKILHPIKIFLRKAVHCSFPFPTFQNESFSQGGYDYSVSLKCPFTEEDFSSINGRPSVHLQRTLRYYRWKVDYLPEGETAYLCIRKNGALSGFLVLRKYPYGTCEICDWMLPGEDIIARDMLKTSSRYLRKFCDVLQVLMVNPAGREPHLLSHSGFFRRKAISQPFMIYPTSTRMDGAEGKTVFNLRNWELRAIDGDTILNG